jgi:hypothetical protein
MPEVNWVRLLLGSLVSLGLLAVTGCGARGLVNSASSSSSSIPAPAASSVSPSASAGETSNTNTISVSAGNTTAGVNVTVSPASGTENATSLGNMADGFAANTGVIVHQASTSTIVLFGTGLSGGMSVTISGPQDIGMSNVRSVQAKDGTPGVAFDAVIGSSTALGARTVYLKAANNDITAFTGGLEVQP